MDWTPPVTALLDVSHDLPIKITILKLLLYLNCDLTGLGDLTWETLTYVCRMTSSDFWIDLICFVTTLPQWRCSTYQTAWIDIHDDCVHQPNKTNEVSLQGKFYMYIHSKFHICMYSMQDLLRVKRCMTQEWNEGFHYSIYQTAPYCISDKMSFWGAKFMNHSNSLLFKQRQMVRMFHGQIYILVLLHDSSVPKNYYYWSWNYRVFTDSIPVDFGHQPVFMEETTISTSVKIYVAFCIKYKENWELDFSQ